MCLLLTLLTHKSNKPRDTRFCFRSGRCGGGGCTVLNGHFYISLRSHGILKKWSRESHGISFPDLRGNPDVS